MILKGIENGSEAIMKKNMKTLLAASTLLAGMAATTFATVGTVNAADGDPVLGTDGNGSVEVSGAATSDVPATGKSKVGIGFSGGDLTLDYVPNLDFGMHKALTGDTYNLAQKAADPSDGDNTSGGVVGRNLIVTDARGKAAATGWTVQAQLGAFTNDGTGSTNLLTNATVTINKTNPIKAGTLYIRPDLTDKPDGFLYGRNSGDDAGPVANTGNITLDASGAAADVMTATIGNGLLTWGMDFQETTSAEIYVPIASQDVQTYIAPMTWTLGTNPIS